MVLFGRAMFFSEMDTETFIKSEGAKLEAASWADTPDCCKAERTSDSVMGNRVLAPAVTAARSSPAVQQGRPEAGSTQFQLKSKRDTNSASVGLFRSGKAANERASTLTTHDEQRDSVTDKAAARATRFNGEAVRTSTSASPHTEPRLTFTRNAYQEALPKRELGTNN